MRYPHLAAIFFACSIALAMTWITVAQGAPSSASNNATAKQAILPPVPVHTIHKQVKAAPQAPTSCFTTQLPQPGIIPQAPPHLMGFRLTTLAIGISGSKAYQIFGGSRADNDGQGVIVLTEISTDPCRDIRQGTFPADQVFPTLLLDGQVTLTTIAGNLVTYTTVSGKVGQFDFVAQIFKS